MKYLFIVNNKPGNEHIKPELERQIAALPQKLDCEFYLTRGRGDAARYARLYCEFAESSDVVLVACGGSGTANEVACAAIEYPQFRMAMMNFGATNDLSKTFPGRDFLSVKDLVEGEEMMIDAVKCNDDYFINTANLGFDSYVVILGNEYIEHGWRRPYERAIFHSLLWHRYNRLKIVADGKLITNGLTTSICIANGKYCGGIYNVAPEALPDDGVVELLRIKSMPIALLLLYLSKYAKGSHITTSWTKWFHNYVKASHIEISARNLIFTSLDGDIVAYRKLVFDVLPKAIRMILPKKND